jgi:hypothetical protein
MQVQQMIKAIEGLPNVALSQVLNAIVKQCIIRKVYPNKNVSEVIAQIEKTVWQGINNESSGGVRP